MHSIETAVTVILFCINAFAIETSLAAENGYIVLELNIPCQEPKTNVVSEACSGYISYKIPDFSKIPYDANITAIFDIFKSILPNLPIAFKALGNPCSDAGIKYLCESSHPFRCEKDYVRVDTQELQATCGRGSEACSRLDKTTREQMFNCSNLENTPGFQHRIPRTFPCEEFPALKDDPFSCDANYKVFSHNSTTLSMTGSGIVFAHKTLKNANIADKECEKKAAEVICKAVLPACSSDHTKIVALLSKEKCREMIGCLNFALGREFQNVCTPLPNEDAARRIPLSSVYIDIEDDIPKIPTTKINMTPTTRTLIQNKTTQTQNRNPSDPNSPTERPHLYSTGHKTTPKSATKPKIITTTQAIITKLNESSALAEVQSDPSLKPTTERPTTHSTYQANMVPTQQAKITKPNKSSKTPTSSVTHENMADVKSDPSLKPKTERPRTHSMNQTKSVPTQQTMIIKPNKSSKTPTFSATYENMADVKSDSSIKPTTERPTNGSTTNSTNQAAQLNTRSNRVALSVISMLYIFMWH